MKLHDAIYGLAIGDAFGVPYEFKKRDTFNVTDWMIGYGTYNKPAGTWSDDTAMTLATLAAIENGHINRRNLADNFLAWKNEGAFTVDGTFDVGGRTKQALDYYATHGEFLQDNDIYSNGNGSLMRILPLAFMNVNDSIIDEISAITHPHEISKMCCKIYVHFIRYMLRYPEADKHTLWKYARDLCGDLVQIDQPKNNVLSDGFVIHTLEAVFYAFFNSDSYKDAIMTAVNLGDDTDTVAAILGGIAGIYYGDFPVEWYETLRGRNIINDVLEQAKSQVYATESV